MEKYFLKTVADKIGVSSIGSRIGVVTFSYFSQLSIKLSDHSDISSFIEAVDNIPLMGSVTMINKGLRLAQKELFRFANGGRAGIPKLLILLTDGSQTQEFSEVKPGDIADELRSNGTNILAVGIGQGVNETELTDIAGNQKSVYILESFDKLIGSDFISTILNKICEAGNVCFPCK